MNELKNFISELASTVYRYEPTEEELKSLDDFLKTIQQNLKGEIWIGKKDYFPYKLTVVLNLKEFRDLKSQIKLDVNLLFTNHNKPVKIDIPLEAKNLEEIILELLAKGYNFNVNSDSETNYDVKMDFQNTSSSLMFPY